MPLALEPVDIVNRALVGRLGAPPIQSLADESGLAQAAQAIYDIETAAIFGSHPWRFARKTYALSRLAGTPVTGWAYAHELPGDRVGPPWKYLTDPRAPEHPLRRFEVEAGEVHSDHANLWAVCCVPVDPTFWPGEFLKAVVVAVAAGLAVPVAHDLTLAEALRREAYGLPQEAGRGGLIGMAIAREAATAPPIAPSHGDDPLTAVRYAGAW